ncbi:hypothetical protein DMENIID0001_048870 [Sergentomyia squamirostris]
MKNILFFLFLTISQIQCKPTSAIDNNFQLILLHNNDIHGRFEEFDQNGVSCKNPPCFGGIPRMLHRIQEIGNQATGNVVFLNAGDSFTGTPLFSAYKENITAEMLNILHPDVVTLGNHEFDYGTNVLSSFLHQLRVPIVVTNLDISAAPHNSSFHRIQSSVVQEISGHQIGFVGYLTPATKTQTQVKDVIFLDEIPAVCSEVEKLKNLGIKIIVALGHSGIEKDLEVAKKCPGISVIVGGHSHTLLHNENEELLNGDEVYGEYPQIVKAENGEVTLVVQAGRHGKYLGQLILNFNDDENLESWSGNTEFLSENIPQEDSIVEVLKTFTEPLREFQEKTVGYTRVHLDGHYRSCRFRECNMGNLIADAIYDAYINSDRMFLPSDEIWSDVSAVMLHSGSIKNSLKSGPIIFADLQTILPYENSFVIVNISGRAIMEALEHSVANYSHLKGYGKFLQFSGLHVIYDLSQVTGHRVVSAKIRCSKCKLPEFESLNLDTWYGIIIPEFIAKGGDGYIQFLTTNSMDLNLDDVQAVERYLQKYSPVYPGIEERIKFRNS